MRLNEIDGYAEAVSRETFLRNAAFVPVCETICGVEVSPLTIGHLATLQSIGNPFVCGGVPDWKDVIAFMCIVSPKSGKPGTWARGCFLRRCRKLPFVVTSDPPRFPVVEAISEFCSDAFQDAPGGNSTKTMRSYYALAAALVGMVAREYHWSESEIMALPLKRLWQYRSEIMSSKGQAPVLFNPSDRLIQHHLNRGN